MRRLFIQDSESPHTTSKLFLLLLSIFISLVMVDWVLGRLLPRFTIEPPFILRFQNVQGIERLWSFTDEGIKPIVFLGSSQLHMGISPHIFNDRIKALTGKDLKSVDISLWGGVITSEQALIQNLVMPTHPQIMIYGIEIQALMPHKQNGPTVEDFRNKPLGYAVSIQSTLERNLLLWLLRNSNLVRYRDNIREWLTGARRINQLGYAPSMVDDLGHFIDPAINERDPEPLIESFTSFTATDYTRQLMASVGTNCQQNNVQCVLLDMPLNEMAYQYIKPSDEAVYYDVLREAGLPIWNFNTKECRELLGDSSFLNLNHLNAAGAEHLSTMVAEVYAHVFYNVTLTGNATCAVLQ